MRKFPQKPASALLVSIILGTVLLTLGLGANQIIIRQVRSQYESSQALQAYYSAQAAIEEGIYLTKKKLPGYEVKEETDLNADSKTDYTLNISAKANNLPCLQDSVDGWYKVPVQKSIKIPLFIANEQGKQKDITDFIVDYYVDRPEQSATFLPANDDVLKWSVIGLNPSSLTANGYLTESINDYLPLQSGNISADKPSYFGTAGEQAYTMAKFYQPESYDNISETTKYIFYDNYSIKTFLENHVSNYLIIENVVDLNKQQAFCNTAECNKIKFRVRSLDAATKFACQTVLISADGFGNQVKQSLDVKYQFSSFLPVFDFALFQYDLQKK